MVVTIFYNCVCVHFLSGLRNQLLSNGPIIEVSPALLGCPRNKQTKILVRTETNRNKICFGFVSVCFVKPKQKISTCFCVSNLYRNIRNKQNCFVTNRNNPKFSEKYPNILSFKLFWWVFCLFRFNRNIETLCFGIETKQPKQTVSKQTEKNRKTRKNP
jgi:hypothetical protein